MANWIFYSASRRTPTVGDLLRSIPSSRLMRLERTVVDSNEETIEAVRAAEGLHNLDATLRLQNDPSGAMRLVVRDADDSIRSEYRDLGWNEPPAERLQLRAQIDLLDDAVEAGHVDLADDLLCGIERLFPGGVAHSPPTGETLRAAEVARVMDPEQTRWSHLDARFVLDDPQRAFILSLLAKLPESVRNLVSEAGDVVRVRGRFPASLDAEAIEKVWSTALECAPYAREGHFRLRESGVWRDMVEGIGTRVATPPADFVRQSQGGVRGVISRLWGRRD